MGSTHEEDREKRIYKGSIEGKKKTLEPLWS